MRAAVFESYQGELHVQQVADPRVRPDSAVIQVDACGICRSDWHGWMGHDSDVQLPHVPGHELAGVVAEVGNDVTRWKCGDRVTVPFCCGCGSCGQCLAGHQHICDNYMQPGFTAWGAFAELVEIRYADVNLVALPESIDSVTAASLGCRFATSFRAVIHQGKVNAGDVVVVHGCGGVGLSAVMIAAAAGARVIAVDINDERLSLAKDCGADLALNAAHVDDVPAAVVDITAGGASLSIDALGSHQTCANSILCLRKRGRHVQIGLTLGTEVNPPISMSTVVAKELELYGSHGMQALEYAPMLQMIETGKLQPRKLIGGTVSLSEACQILPRMNDFPGRGVTVINRF
ncbi:MAG: alcohol dehydrogenase catalytic domain-containing protein [Fuerstiella sp.]|nr:alcohol dehydrogenase catalytic domain-containing protein [Fuerstiella sp.]MCP4854104.1 alcohol dehydrogenase catalytic domain-containing protein [Fuerstiella sp.]